MTALYFIITFVFGTIYGSFLNVLLYRFETGEHIGGRSHCRSCSHQLAWYDLVPLLSFIILKGKCRYCSAPIHLRYPAVELITGLALAGFLFNQGFALDPKAALGIFAVFVLVSLFFFDLFYFTLPDKLTVPAMGIFLVWTFFTADWQITLAAALLLGSFFAILYMVSHGAWLGFGDVKLAILVGLILGYPAGAWAVLFAIWGGALVGLALIVLKKAGRKTPLPFGSFLTAATLVLMIFQHELLFLQKLF